MREEILHSDNDIWTQMERLQIVHCKKESSRFNFQNLFYQHLIFHSVLCRIHNNNNHAELNITENALEYLEHLFFFFYWNIQNQVHDIIIASSFR